MIVFLLLFIAYLCAVKMQRDAQAFKSDEDLMERWIVFEHRRYRKSINKPYLY